MQVGAVWRSSLRARGIVLAAMLALAPQAAAADLWTQDRDDPITLVNYWQGIAFAPASGAFFFDGPATGLGGPTPPCGARPDVAPAFHRR